MSPFLIFLLVLGIGTAVVLLVRLIGRAMSGSGSVSSFGSSGGASTGKLPETK